MNYMDKMQRGFSLPSDVPVECLCGFIEGRVFRDEVLSTIGVDGQPLITTIRHLDFTLYDLSGQPITVPVYAGAAQP